MHPFQRHVEIDVATSQKNRCAGQGTGVFPRLVAVFEQCTTQSNDAAIALWMASGILQRQAGALRKAKQKRMLWRNARCLHLCQQIVNNRFAAEKLIATGLASTEEH